VSDDMSGEELCAHLEGLVERRNRYAGQARGLADRLERLESKIDAIDAELAQYR